MNTIVAKQCLWRNCVKKTWKLDCFLAKV